MIFIFKACLIFFVACFVECQTRLHVSKIPSSQDVPSCGVNVTLPCKTIKYTIEERAKNITNLEVHLAPGELSQPFHYKEDSTITTAHNINIRTTDISSVVKPIIQLVKGIFLMNVVPSEERNNNDNNNSNKFNRTILFRNIHFFGLSVVNVSDTNVRLDIIDCRVEKSSKHVIFSEVAGLIIDAYLTSSIFLQCNGIISLELTSVAQVHISGSQFTGVKNHNEYTGISITNIDGKFILTVEKSSFRNVYKAITLTSLNQTCIPTKSLKVKHSTFTGNAKCISVTGCFTSNIQFSSFTENTDGVLALTNNKNVIIYNSTFVGNSRRSAVTLIRNALILITKSTFTKNTDRFQGGAIFGYDNTINIHSSHFLSNFAPLSGGTIYCHGTGINSTHLSLTEVTIVSMPGKYTKTGTLVYSSQMIKLKDSILSLEVGPLDTVNSHLDGIVSSTAIVIVPEKFEFRCPINTNPLLLSVLNITRTGVPFIYGVSSMTCIQCPPQTYSLIRVNVTTSKLRYDEAECHPCPDGGNCSNRIVSQDNYWGSLHNNEFAFTQCPPSYCCSKDTTSCTSYQTCHNNREGVLCGKCKQSHILDFFSDSCRQNNNETCSRTGFWLLNLLYAFIISCCFLNLEYVILTLDGIWKRQKNVNTTVVTNIRTVDDEGSINDDVINLCDNTSNRQRPSVNGTSDENYADFIIGFGKVLAFFYQIEVLLRFKLTKSYGILSVIEDFILSFFNFRFDTNRFSSLCPGHDLNQITKELAKLFNVFLCPVLIALLYGMISAVRYLQRKNQDGDLKFRFRQCLLHLCLFSYTNIANFCILMVNCVNIFGTSYLFYHGETQCYVWWQYLVFVIIIEWLIPFPIALYFGIKLLRSYSISPMQFYVLMVFPWMSVVYYCISRRGNASASEVDADRKMEVDCILQVFVGPFRDDDEKSPTNWESVILSRRLILSIVCGVVVDPTTRLFMSLPLLATFLLHHVYLRPFKSTFNNVVETLSLTLLIWFNATHLLMTFSYANSWTNNVSLKNGVFILSAVQQVLIVIPALLFLLFIVFSLLKKFVVFLLSGCTQR